MAANQYSVFLSGIPGLALGASPVARVRSLRTQFVGVVLIGEFALLSGRLIDQSRTGVANPAPSHYEQGSDTQEDFEDVVLDRLGVDRGLACDFEKP